MQSYCLAIALVTLFPISQPSAQAQEQFHLKKIVRSYEAHLTAQEKKNIGYIVETLGNGSLFTIAKEKSSLQKAGRQVEGVHPLQFLSYVFSEEKLKSAMQNMRSRGWIWREFTQGLRGSLEEEYHNDNITEGQLIDFVTKVQIDLTTIVNLVEERRWKDFLVRVMEEVPQNPYANRYDM